MAGINSYVGVMPTEKMAKARDVGPRVRIKYNEVERLKELITQALKKRAIYPTKWTPTPAYYIITRCTSWMHDNIKICFSRKPENAKEYELMEKYVILRHVLHCPYPAHCLTTQKAIILYPSIKVET